MYVRNETDCVELVCIRLVRFGRCTDESDDSVTHAVTCEEWGGRIAILFRGNKQDAKWAYDMVCRGIAEETRFVDLVR